MQVGLVNPNSTSGSRSVAQRISAIKDSASNSLSYYHGTDLLGATSARPLQSVVSGRMPAALCSCDKVQNFKPTPVILTEMQRNTVRVIGQYLRDLGMSDTVDSLVEESGCRIENPLSLHLRDHINHGAWNKALEVIEKFRPMITESQYTTVRVLLLEEKFKDLVSRDELLLALRILQMEYPKAKELKDRLEYWSTVLCSTNPKELCQKLDADSWMSGEFIDPIPSNNQHVLNLLRKLLPPSLILPPNRLQELLRQSWLHQIKQCDLHVISPEGAVERSILTDHQCTSNDFPAKNTTTLYLHNSEVWCLKFSPCGRYLASGAKGSNVLIWKVDSPRRITIYQNVTVHPELVGVGCLSWSHDSRYLAVTSSEDSNYGVFIFYVTTGRLIKEFKHYPNDTFSNVSFFKNPSYRFACGDMKGHFHAYDIQRTDEQLHAFEGFRIRCLYSSKDGRTVLAADSHHRIRSYDFDTRMETTIIQENSQIIYFTVDRSERYCLVTTKTEGIRLWCLKTGSLVRSFFGANHSEFVVSSSFGGPDCGFFASGSEDDTVVVWNINKTQPVRRLIGHTGTVNTVAWNPVRHGMLASGSDDGTIRIWATSSSSM